MAQYRRIKDLRIDNDLTQQECAKKLGMQLTTYNRYERGEREIPFAIAIRLARFYNVSLDYLAECTNDPDGDGKNKRKHFIGNP